MIDTIVVLASFCACVAVVVLAYKMGHHAGYAEMQRRAFEINQSLRGPWSEES